MCRRRARHGDHLRTPILSPHPPWSSQHTCWSVTGPSSSYAGVLMDGNVAASCPAFCCLDFATVDAIDTELRRVARRWRELPITRADAAALEMRGLVQALADEVRASAGLETLSIPDLGTPTLTDQLAVMVYDAQQAGLSVNLAERLVRLRHILP